MKFNSIELQKIASDSKSKIEKHLQDLDRLSSDIKTLEKFLHETGLKSSTLHISGKGDMSFSEGRISFAYNGYAPKRLIEYKVINRIELGKHLPKFMEYCIKNVGE